MSVLTKGGGDLGNYLEIACVPSSALETSLDALIAAGTDVIGKLVSFSTGANYEVASTADGAVPDGKIVRCEKRGSTYSLTCRIWHYTDQNSTGRPAIAVVNVAYSGSMALGDTLELSQGTTFYTVRDATTGGAGRLIGLDVPGSGFADFIV